MAVASKRSPGRPRKRPLEKPEQFSIRLTPPTKVMLEMMARDRNVSLSQAVQTLINDVASKYVVDGQTLADTMQERMANATGELTELEERYRSGVPEFEPIERQTAIFNSKAGPLFLMPERLLKPNELALVRACLTVGRLPSDDELSALDADGTTMITLGRSVDETTEYLIGRLRSSD